MVGFPLYGVFEDTQFKNWIAWMDIVDIALDQCVSELNLWHAQGPFAVEIVYIFSGKI